MLYSWEENEFFITKKCGQNYCSARIRHVRVQRNEYVFRILKCLYQSWKFIINSQFFLIWRKIFKTLVLIIQSFETFFENECVDINLLVFCNPGIKHKKTTLLVCRSRKSWVEAVVIMVKWRPRLFLNGGFVDWKRAFHARKRREFNEKSVWLVNCFVNAVSRVTHWRWFQVGGAKIVS